MLTWKCFAWASCAIAKTTQIVEATHFQWPRNRRKSNISERDNYSLILRTKMLSVGKLGGVMDDHHYKRRRCHRRRRGVLHSPVLRVQTVN